MVLCNCLTRTYLEYCSDISELGRERECLLEPQPTDCDLPFTLDNAFFYATPGVPYASAVVPPRTYVHGIRHSVVSNSTMSSRENYGPCLLNEISVGIVTCLSVLSVVVLLRWRKVAWEHRRCFDRIEQAGFQRNRLLRCLEKSVALSVPPASGTNGKQQKPMKKGLVLIGGFGDMPNIWEELSDRASKAGWYTLAPRTPGWGRTDFEEVNHISWRDWVLACRDAVVVVRGLCEEVTVVAHSTGAPVAALVAEMLPVDRLIFTGPNFVSQVSDRWGKELLLKPIVGPLLTQYLDTVAKKRRSGRPIDNLNEAVYQTAFYLTCFPVRPLRQMWMLQNQLSRPWIVSLEVILLMGESDGSVAPLPEQVDRIKPFLPEGVPFRAFSIPDAAHGLPIETKPVVDTLASIVLGDKGVLDRLMSARNTDGGVMTSEGESRP